MNRPINAAEQDILNRLPRTTINTETMKPPFPSEKDRLLMRCRSELRSILADINADRIPHDGDDFHEMLRDLDAALDPTKHKWKRAT